MTYALRAALAVIAATAAVAVRAQPSATAPAAPAAPAPLTLPEAAAIALARSPELAQAEARIDQAQAVRDQAARDWLPKITVEAVAGLRRLENAARNSLNLSALNERPLYAGISVQQPLIDMGRRSYLVAAQEARAEAAREDRERAAEGMAFEAARAYLIVLLYQRLLTDAQENLGFHERLSADMRAGLAVGVMTIAERQQADERRQLARVRLAEAERDLQTARNLFAAVIGQPPVGLAMPDSAAPILPPTVDEAAMLAQQWDPRVRRARSELAAAEAMARRSRADGLPSVDAAGSARTGTDFDGYRGRTEDYSATLALRWTLFDGGVNAARRREAQGKVAEASAALDQARRDSEREARDGWQQIATWRATLNEQIDHARIARDLVYSYRAQFGIGRRSLLDVLDAQNAAFTAAARRDTAQVSRLLAEYALLAQANALRAHLGVGPAPASASDPLVTDRGRD